MLNLSKCLPVITWNKNHSSKQVLSMIYTLGKDISAASTFKGFSDKPLKRFLFRQSKKAYSILWPTLVFFDQVNTLDRK